MSRVLTIIEVSQKQAYIFESNKLKDNVSRSAEIAYITGPKYIAETAESCSGEGLIFSEEENLVYSGGGHTILEFSSKMLLKILIQALTERVLREFPGMALFAAAVDYDEEKTPGENVKALTAALEGKKSLRRSFFHQGTFGIEEIDINTGKARRAGAQDIPKIEEKTEAAPRGFVYCSKFEDLGGSKNDSNFIAVVHIDGNAMGKRVEDISSAFAVGEWDKYKSRMRLFSESVANDFLGAYREMEQELADRIWDGGLSELSLSYKDDRYYLPVRRIISEGDDICFVSEGRIGVECAAAYLRFLGKKTNSVDGRPYAACAGVALVHQKYPFYRAYELAEALCSNAKRFGATLAGEKEGAGISSVDWHIEYGEIQDSLEETRELYRTADGKRLELRPYIVQASSGILEKEPVRQYDHFCTLMDRLTSKKDSYGRGTMKELRTVLRRGADAAAHYLRFHQIEDIGRDAWYGVYQDLDMEKIRIGESQGLERRIFVSTADGIERSILFDAIELMDTYLPLEGASR